MAKKSIMRASDRLIQIAI